jgi:hypothetical protein
MALPQPCALDRLGVEFCLSCNGRPQASELFVFKDGYSADVVEI